MNSKNGDSGDRPTRRSLVRATEGARGEGGRVNRERRLDHAEQRLQRMGVDPDQEKRQIRALSDKELTAELRACAALLGKPLSAWDLELIEALEALDRPPAPRPLPVTTPEPARREPVDEPVTFSVEASEPVMPLTPALDPVAYAPSPFLHTVFQPRAPTQQRCRCGAVFNPDDQITTCPNCGSRFPVNPLASYPKGLG